MKINEKIRNIRLSKGYTQEYVAIKMNIDPVNYGRLERGQTKITIDKLEKLSEIFGVKITDFFDEDEKNNEKENTEIITLLKKIYKTELEILNEIKKCKP